MLTFRERLRRAIDRSHYSGNYKKLSLDAGMSENQVSNLLRKSDVDASPIGPGIFSMARLAELIQVDLRYLADGRPREAGYVGGKDFAKHFMKLAESSRGQFIDNAEIPTPQGLLRTHIRSGGRIAAFKDVLTFCDQYEPYRHGDTRVVVKSVGVDGLAARTMQSSDKSILQRALDESNDKELMPTIISNHRDALKYGTLSTAKFLNAQMPNKPVLVRMDYILTLLSVVDDSGNRSTLSYASLIA